MIANNKRVEMTRRFPQLRKKVLMRDAVIAKKIIAAWDVEHDAEKALSIYLKEKNNLSDERYWEVLRTVWVIAGSLKSLNVFRELMLSSRPQRYYFSTPEEAEKLRNMPQFITVYRAGSINDGGISWTLSQEYAEQYLKDYQKEKVLTLTVPKSRVFAYIERNLEQEIILI